LLHPIRNKKYLLRKRAADRMAALFSFCVFIRVEFIEEILYNGRVRRIYYGDFY